MRIFETPNLDKKDWECPVCKTRDVEPVTLIPINGTETGNIVKAEQYHVSCIELKQFSMEPDDTLVIAMPVNR